MWQDGVDLWSLLMSCKGQQNYFCHASTRKMAEAQASWINEQRKCNTQELKKNNIFLDPSFLRSLQSCTLTRSISDFVYLCWFYPSIPSIAFNSWCFLEEMRSQECLSRVLTVKERPCSPYYSKRRAQCLFNRKVSTWEGDKKGQSGWMPRLWKCFS